MIEHQFKEWLDKLKNAWEKRNPNAAVDLCAEKFLWYETPFDKPFDTKEQVLNDWKGVLNQENISFSYQILSIVDNVGIAHWTAAFTKLPSREKVDLDGIFKVTLNQKGECTEFHQWRNSKK